MKIPAGATLHMSPSVYMAWRRGDRDIAYKYVRGIEGDPTAAMIRGRQWHEKFDLETKQTGKTPAIFNLDIAVEDTEITRIHKFQGWWQLKGVADAITTDSVIDYKTTESDTITASSYLNSGQIEIYCFLFKKKIGEIICLNVKTNAITRVRKHISLERMKQVLEDVGDVAGEIRMGLEQQGIPWWRND